MFQIFALLIFFIGFSAIASENISLKNLTKDAPSIQTHFGETVVKIKKIKNDKVKLDKWIKDQQFLFLSQVKATRTPYQGALTQEVSCPDKLKPEKLHLDSNNFAGGFLYFSDSRFVQSTCINQNIKYISALLLFSCHEWAYKIKIHQPSHMNKERLSKLAQRIQCG